ncbi:cyclic pyranopterin monophosphate synthase MoaC [Bacteroidota bacterium]
MGKLSHVDSEGRANMVDVGSKPLQYRTAKAEGKISLQPETVELIRENKMKKGDVLSIAEIAGIQGGKKTSDLIPLCHPLQITKLNVNAELIKEGVKVTSLAKCIGQTGIEMEAITAVSIALLTIYDMCKAVDKQMKIGEIVLTEKSKSDSE